MGWFPQGTPPGRVPCVRVPWCPQVVRDAPERSHAQRADGAPLDQALLGPGLLTAPAPAQEPLSARRVLSPRVTPTGGSSSQRWQILLVGRAGPGGPGTGALGLGMWVPGRNGSWQRLHTGPPSQGTLGHVWTWGCWGALPATGVLLMVPDLQSRQPTPHTRACTHIVGGLCCPPGQGSLWASKHSPPPGCLTLRWGTLPGVGGSHPCVGHRRQLMDKPSHRWGWCEEAWPGEGGRAGRCWWWSTHTCPGADSVAGVGLQETADSGLSLPP